MSDKRGAIIELHRAGWCKNHFPHFWSKEDWSPSSPDLNLTDFCVWSLLEANASDLSHDSVYDLKGSLKKALEKYLKEHYT